MEVITLAVAFVGGSFITALFTWLTSKKGRDIDAMSKVYPILTSEINRLIHSNDRLTILVEALENEILFLGGSPDRIRKTISERIRE